MNRIRERVFRGLFVGIVVLVVVSARLAGAEEPPLERFFAAASIDVATAEAAQAEIAANWRDGYAAMFVDMIDLLNRTGFVDPRGFVRLARLVQFLENRTGQSFGSDFVAWRRWVWELPYDPHPDYGEFKGVLYAELDPRFAEFFPPRVKSSIRLDEIQWGGVAVNGIPPLDHPAVIDAADADYLDSGNVVFGVFINGEARAYPKRILAWHELALDDVGGKALTIVYCTLCGTVIPFDSDIGGETRTFGTSGLLYQSNKLMFDAATHSLWSSLTGEPVVGPLVGSGLVLEALPVVTTTWGEWLRRHPDTAVLSLGTGYARDYSEGAAYRAYFGTDQLMFDVSEWDGRLPNKAEVLVLRSVGGEGQSRLPPFAISVELLAAKPVLQVTVDDNEFVVLTDSSGANRVYRAETYRFEEFDGADRVVDAEGRSWHADEVSLRADFDPSLELPRAPAHRAFWFGWYAQHPDTVLVE